MLYLGTSAEIKAFEKALWRASCRYKTCIEPMFLDGPSCRDGEVYGLGIDSRKYYHVPGARHCAWLLASIMDNDITVGSFSPIG